MAVDLLTEQQAHDILSRANFRGTPVVTLIKRTNHVYQLECGAESFFLKIYTKDWYGDPASTGFCVDHEASAWRTLAAHGLDVPQVVLAEQGCENPLQRPFLLTRALPGRALTELLHSTDPAQFRQLLEAVGYYLHRMHAIRFPFPGYITSAGLNAPPASDQWQHFIWTFTRFSREVTQVWEADQANVPTDLRQGIEAFFTQHMSGLATVYKTPRFTHGDCHAHQFFLHQVNGQWQVSGVVDLEVASAGDSGADWVKVALELAGAFPVATEWWDGLFMGYRGAPNFELFKLRLLAAAHINYKCLGAGSWPGTRPQILAHVLSAPDWRVLFDLPRIVDSG